jgi:hypothetical protein
MGKKIVRHSRILPYFSIVSLENLQFIITNGNNLFNKVGNFLLIGLNELTGAKITTDSFSFLCYLRLRHSIRVKCAVYNHQYILFIWLLWEVVYTFHFLSLKECFHQERQFQTRKPKAGIPEFTMEGA